MNPRVGRTVASRFEDEVLEAHLTPGGRWLFGMQETRIVVWELGIPGCGVVDKGVLMEVSYSEHLYTASYMSLSAPTPAIRAPPPGTQTGRNLLRIAAWVQAPYEGPETVKNRFEIYEVGPLPHDIRIRRLATLEIAECSEVHRFWLSENDDFVFIYFDHIILVWDFERNLFTWWELRMNILKLFNAGPLVMAITPSGVSGWRVLPHTFRIPKYGKEGNWISFSHNRPKVVSHNFCLKFDAVPWGRYWWRWVTTDPTSKVKWHYSPDNVDLTPHLPRFAVLNLVYYAVRQSNEFEGYPPTTDTDEAGDLLELWRSEIEIPIPGKQLEGNLPSDSADDFGDVTAKFSLACVKSKDEMPSAAHLFTSFFHDHSRSRLGEHLAIIVPQSSHDRECESTPYNLLFSPAEKPAVGSGDAPNVYIISSLQSGSQDHTDKTTAFCPYSGRLAYICSNDDHNHDGGSGIHVVDFFY